MEQNFGKEIPKNRVLNNILGDITTYLVTRYNLGKNSQKIGCWTKFWEKFSKNWFAGKYFGENPQKMIAGH